MSHTTKAAKIGPMALQLEVEFLDREGHTRCVVTLSLADVLLLNRERTKVA